MRIVGKRHHVLLVAGLVLVFVAGACLPGCTASPTAPPAEVMPPATAPTDTPAAAEPTATPAQTSRVAPLRQWAVGAAASSEFGSPEWSAQQATGAPNVPGCIEDARAWASKDAHGVDWLEVSFARAVIPTEINIRETNSPGYITRVEVKDEAGLYHTVWEGTPGAVEQCPHVLTVAVSGVNVRVNAVRINLDQRIRCWYDEIDSVELVGQR